MTKYETTNVHISYVGAAIALADKKIHLEKAEQIARASVGALKKRREEARWAYKTDKEFEDAVRTAPVSGYDAIGWVLFAQGRLDEAETELLKAYELSPGNRENLHHLGRFYEAKNDIARAEEFYIKESPCRALARILPKRLSGRCTRSVTAAPTATRSTSEKCATAIASLGRRRSWPRGSSPRRPWLPST